MLGITMKLLLTQTIGPVVSLPVVASLPAQNMRGAGISSENGSLSNDKEAIYIACGTRDLSYCGF